MQQDAADHISTSDKTISVFELVRFSGDHTQIQACPRMHLHEQTRMSDALRSEDLLPQRLTT